MRKGGSVFGGAAYREDVAPISHLSFVRRKELSDRQQPITPECFSWLEKVCEVVLRRVGSATRSGGNALHPALLCTLPETCKPARKLIMAIFTASVIGSASASQTDPA